MLGAGGGKKKVPSPCLTPTAFKFLTAVDCASARVPVDVRQKIDPHREETAQGKYM